MPTFEPIRFHPVYQTYLWGGRQLPERYGRTDAPPSGPVAESWEVSDRSDGMSVAVGGAFDGRTFQSLLDEHAEDMLGKSNANSRFPLLIKIIDAQETLSVQVHPDDAAAAQGIGEAKSEAWYVLDALPGACIYRGFRPGVTRNEVDEALRDGRIDDLLVRYSVSPGDTIYIPGGTVHAIGHGCLLLEVQQNSNTTFRLFDWNRVGPDGKPRTLHIEEARNVIRWETDETHQPAEDGRCITPYFSIESVSLSGRPLSAVDPLRGFTVVFVEEGPVILKYAGAETIAPAGSSWFIPAALKNCKIARPPSGTGRVVLIRGNKSA